VQEEQAGGDEDEVFQVLEDEQRDAGAAERDVVGGYRDEVDAGEATAAEDKGEAGGDENGERDGEHDQCPVESDHGQQVHDQHVDGHVVIGRHAVDTRPVLTTTRHLEQRLHTDTMLVT